MGVQNLSCAHFRAKAEVKGGWRAGGFGCRRVGAPTATSTRVHSPALATGDCRPGRPPGQGPLKVTSTLARGARPGLDVGWETGGMGASLLPRREFQPETLLKVEGSREETAGSAASGEGYSVHGNLSDLSPAARDGEMLS